MGAELRKFIERCLTCGVDEGEHRPGCPNAANRGVNTTAQSWGTALARARQSADDSLRGRIDGYLNLPGPLATRGKLPRGRYCQDCRLTARYPDNRCPAHTAYLTGTDAERRAYDSDDALWLSLWRRWWEQVRALLGPT